MRHTVYHQFRDYNELVCVLQIDISYLDLNCLYAVRKYVVWLFQPHGVAHHSGLCVPSACKRCGYFNHKAWLTILASFCAISM